LQHDRMKPTLVNRCRAAQAPRGLPLLSCSF
jgi:hypothetical protein